MFRELLLTILILLTVTSKGLTRNFSNIIFNNLRTQSNEINIKALGFPVFTLKKVSHLREAALRKNA